ERQRTIGDGGQSSASAVTCGPWVGARTVWPDMQQSATVQPCNRSPARANASHVDRWKACQVTPEARTEPSFGCQRDSPIANQTLVVTGPSSVCNDDVRAGSIELGFMTGGYGCDARSRLHQMDRSLSGCLHVYEAALAGDDQEPPCKA